MGREVLRMGARRSAGGMYNPRAARHFRTGKYLRQRKIWIMFPFTSHPEGVHRPTKALECDNVVLVTSSTPVAFHLSTKIRYLDLIRAN